VDDLLILLGYGKILPADVVEKVVPEERRKVEKEPAAEVPTPTPKLARRVSRRPTAGIMVAGEDDVLVRFGKCCSPVPGDPIVGFITRGRGVTVHTRECQKGMDQDPDRWVEVAWDGKLKTPRPVTLQVVCADKPGLLAHMSQAFSEAGVNISQANCRSTEDNRAVNTFQAMVTDLEQLKGLMRPIQKISGVYAVDRL
jgi:guanosine-3',5'-bis(diphosphate) 3'-pyrophosphohydrolase